MPTDIQRDAADRIASEYDGPEAVRITPDVGPDRDRMVISFPGGDVVVLDADGEVFADSRGVIFGGPLARGYEPSIDALVIESGEEDHVLVPPTRCALSPTGFLPPEGLDELLATCRRWHKNVVGGDLKTWVLRQGACELEEFTP